MSRNIFEKVKDLLLSFAACQLCLGYMSATRKQRHPRFAGESQSATHIKHACLLGILLLRPGTEDAEQVQLQKEL